MQSYIGTSKVPGTGYVI